MKKDISRALYCSEIIESEVTDIQGVWKNTVESTEVTLICDDGNSVVNCSQ